MPPIYHGCYYGQNPVDRHSNVRRITRTPANQSMPYLAQDCTHLRAENVPFSSGQSGPRRIRHAADRFHPYEPRGWSGHNGRQQVSISTVNQSHVSPDASARGGALLAVRRNVTGFNRDFPPSSPHHDRQVTDVANDSSLRGIINFDDAGHLTNLPLTWTGLPVVHGSFPSNNVPCPVHSGVDYWHCPNFYSYQRMAPQHPMHPRIDFRGGEPAPPILFPSMPSSNALPFDIAMGNVPFARRGNPDPGSRPESSNPFPRNKTSAVGTRSFAFTPTTEDGESLQSISAMRIYRDKSFEELRMEDYMMGNKGVAKVPDHCAREAEANGKSAAEGDKNVCVICLDNKKSILFLPCSHMCVCSNCSSDKSTDKCPVCRHKIESRTNVFW